MGEDGNRRNRAGGRRGGGREYWMRILEMMVI